MLIGVIADDFTGASDIGVTLVKGLVQEGGLNTTLYMGVPEGQAQPDIAAGVIALKSRSLPVQEAVDQALAACDWLLHQGCQQILFKYCSTFDSTAAGNIGPVGEALAARLSARGVVVCPAFPDMGRTLYQGHLFVADKLLNESGMENHPLTPMKDADIRRVLAEQSQQPQGFIPWSTVQKGAQAVKAALAQRAQAGDWLVVVDAITNADLVTLGAACDGAALITGGSAIAQGLAHNFIAHGKAQGTFPTPLGVEGPGAILVGSCSRMTLRQIARHQQQHDVMRIDPQALLAGSVDVQTVVDFVFAHQSGQPLVTTSDDAARVSDLQRRFGRDAVALAIEAFFARLAVALVEAGISRLVVGGGETSGAVVKGLAVDSVVIGAEIGTGVPALLTHRQGNALALALKSGNFGDEDFFSTAFMALAQP